MENNDKEPLINEVAKPFDVIADLNKDIRVAVGTNEGGNQVYLKRYSYSNTTISTFQISMLVLAVGTILLALNLFNVFQNNFWLIAFGWGLAFLVIDIPFYFATVYRENIGKKLKTDGSSKKVSATVVKIKRGFFPGGIQSRTLLSVGYTNPFPYIIVANWKNESTNKEYNFKSLLLSNNPSEKFKVGSNVVVYLDPQNYNRSFVDTGDFN